ncbi:MAG: hypothetical protein ABIH92_05830 [Nanoarchaeota archaeon]
MTDRKSKNVENARKILAWLIILEIAVFCFLVVSVFLPYFELALAVVGEDNATVQTFLQVGNVYPEVLSVIINDGASSIDLAANSTVVVNVSVVVRDYNGDTDIQNVTMRFFDSNASSYLSSADNNDHYRNDSCSLDLGYGSAYEAQANCTLDVYYYANNQTWNATVEVTDNATWTGTNSNTTTINSLLALALPSTINYGVVNATEVSTEKLANVTNVGNVVLNLSLSGYGAIVGDGLAMNCTVGNIQNISIEYEQYNLTSSNNSVLDFAQFDSLYINLTSSPVINLFDLYPRTNDTAPYLGDTNASYWRVYVPVGVAGNCSGNIVFGAVQYPIA